MNEEEICGTCKFHKIYIDGEWECTNKDGEMYGLWTDYLDRCEDWEGKE